MKLKFVTLDVFTTTRFKGNQLAVLTVPSPLVPKITYDQKRQIAKEFNLAETVFILEPSDPSETNVPVNIYLPSTEIPFAGHPTIGTGIYLLHYLQRPVKSIQPAAGRCPLSYDSSTHLLSASIPHAVHLDSHPVSPPSPSSPLHSLLSHVGSSPYFSIVKGMTFALIRLPHLEALALATQSIPDPDPSSLDPTWDNGFRGTKYYVDLGFDSKTGQRKLRTRFHGAEDDAVEDAATGSASCALACYLALHDHGYGGEGEGKGEGEMQAFHVKQGVEMGRESNIYVGVKKTKDGKGVEEVVLRGSAVLVMEGSITIDD